VAAPFPPSSYRPFRARLCALDGITLLTPLLCFYNLHAGHDDNDDHCSWKLSVHPISLPVSLVYACHSTRSLKLSNTNLLSAHDLSTSPDFRSCNAVSASQLLKSGILSYQLSEGVPVLTPDNFRHPLFPTGLPTNLAIFLMHLRVGFC